MISPEFNIYISVARTRIIISSLLFSIFFYFHICSASQIEQLQYQLQDIENKIQNTNSSIQSCNLTLEKLTQDSINTVTQFQSSQSQRKGPLSNLEMDLVTASQQVETLKREILQAKQDSIQTSMKLEEQRNSFKRENGTLQKLITAASNDLKSMRSQRDQYLLTASLTSNNNITTINAENARIDLLLSKYHNELANLSANREHLKQDSTLKVSQLQSDMAIASSDLKALDTEIAAANLAVQEASNRLSQVKKKRSESQLANNQVLQSYTNQRAKTLSSLNLTTANLTKNQNDYQRIRSGLDATMAKYEKGKVPFQIKIRGADSTLQTRQLQKSLWTVMKEKFSVDSAISAARNDLDEIIQQAAKKRKNATKLTEQKEAELNGLLGKLDLILEKPGVKQASNQLASLTVEQKRARIQEVLSNIDNDIVKQTSMKQQALQALLNYEKSNPAASNPSVQQLQKLEKTLASLQSQQQYYSGQKDSLDNLVASQSQVVNKTEAQFQKEIRQLDSTFSILSKRSIALTSKRSQKQQTYSISHQKTQNAINKIIFDLKDTDNRINTINREIVLCRNRKEQLKSELANSSQLFEQQKIQASASAQNIVNLIAKKEQEFASLSNQLQQTNIQNGQITQNLQNNLSITSSSLQSLNSKLYSATVQYQNLQRQQNNLNTQLFSSEKELSAELREISSAKAKSNQQLSTLLAQLQQLKSRKSALLETIKTETERNAVLTYESQKSSLESQQSKPPSENPKPVKPVPAHQFQVTTQASSRSLQQYDSLIIAREQELSRLRDQRNKALQERNAETAPEAFQVTRKEPTPVSKSGQSSSGGKERQIQSQKIIEQIYSLLGEEKNAEAYRMFLTNKEFLKNTAPVEAIRILESTFDGMQLSDINSSSWE